MKDVSKWLVKSFGLDGTLPMKVLLSPNGSYYYMKFGWKSKELRTHLEHINEVVAAKIAKLLHLNTIEAELAVWKDEYGCLTLDYVEQYNAMEDEAGAVLLELELEEQYRDLQQDLTNTLLINKAFSLLEKFSYIKQIRSPFIAMNLFDILIGNQDRHPYNWIILFKGEDSFFGPLFDNGASLGFQLPDKKLEEMLNNDGEFDKYYAKMKVKAGIFEAKKPPIQASKLLEYCINHYKNEVKAFKKSLAQFPFENFDSFVDDFPLFTQIRKKFIKQFIRHRQKKMLSFIKEGINIE